MEVVIDVEPRARWTVAIGGGGIVADPDGPLVEALLGLAREVRRVEQPRVCLLATASGDQADYIAGFHAALAGRAGTTHLGLFERTVDDVEGLLLGQDLVYVSGGNTANLLAIWRLHGVDGALRRAWEAGVVLGGVSAGALCWFEAGTTDSFGPALRPLSDGLGFLPGSFCPHYDNEPTRRPTYHALVADGRLPAGYAADDGVALVFRDRGLDRVVSTVPGARGYRVERGEDGQALEIPLADPRPMAASG